MGHTSSRGSLGRRRFKPRSCSIRRDKLGAHATLLNSRIFPADPQPNYRGTVWWCAYDGRDAIAFAGLRSLGHGLAMLERAGVIDRYRGQGLQRRLIQTRVRWAKREGIKTLITYTLTSNIWSANNLIACGFRLYEPDYAWVGRKKVLYWRKDFY